MSNKYYFLIMILISYFWLDPHFLSSVSSLNESNLMIQSQSTFNHANYGPKFRHHLTIKGRIPLTFKTSSYLLEV